MASISGMEPWDKKQQKETGVKVSTCCFQTPVLHYGSNSVQKVFENFQEYFNLPNLPYFEPLSHIVG